MLWLYNNNINFYQIFVNSKLVYNQDNNIIYSFESNNICQDLELNEPDLSNIKYIEFNFEIRIIDQLISYINTVTNDNIVFTFKMNFIEPSENKFKIPIFNYSYKKVNNNRMPNLIITNYNLYAKLCFKIYNINENLQYIIETNPITKIIKKYWITTELNLIDNYKLK